MDREIISLTIDTLAAMTLAAQIFIVFFGLVLLVNYFDKKNSVAKNIIGFFSLNAVPFSFLVAVVATIGSLFLSEVAAFTPCKLCWYQRIFMYPQVVLLGIAAFINDNGIRKYVIPLVVIGLAIAIYHYALQMSPLPLPCTDEVASCAAKQAARFGYITIPMMAGTAFALILLLMMTSRRK